jgi:hypothetical protein
MIFMKKYLVAFLAVSCLAMLTAGMAMGDSLPSSKIAAALGGINILQQVSAPAGPTDSGWTPILRTKIKTAEQKDLIFNVSAECGIYTSTKVSSKLGTPDTSSAAGSVLVRIKVTGPSGTIRYAAPEGNPLVEQVGVVFNRRTQTMTATFMGIFTGSCLIVDPVTHAVTIDPDCVQPETLELILDTLEANAFNFLLADVNSGIQTVEVQARLQANASAQTGSATGKALIGLGSLIVESGRLIKDADGTPTLQ